VRTGTSLQLWFDRSDLH